MLSSRRKAVSCAASALIRDESRPSFHAHLAQPFSPAPQSPVCNYVTSVSRRGECRLPVPAIGKLLREPRFCTPSWVSLYRPHRFASAIDTSVAGHNCWSCGAAASVASRPFLACPSCGSVQPVDSSIDYFDIFGVAKGYKFEEENLESKYKDWQKKLHPDLVHTKSERERNYAAEQSARVIDAYRTLAKPLSRALYLLRLRGVDVNEEETLTDPELLTEALEIREAVEEANDSGTLKKIKSDVETKLEFWRKSFASAYNSQDFSQAVTATRRMTYYEKALQQIMEKL